MLECGYTHTYPSECLRMEMCTYMALYAHEQYDVDCLLLLYKQAYLRDMLI